MVVTCAFAGRRIRCIAGRLGPMLPNKGLAGTDVDTMLIQKFLKVRKFRGTSIKIPNHRKQKVGLKLDFI